MYFPIGKGLNRMLNFKKALPSADVTPDPEVICLFPLVKASVLKLLWHTNPRFHTVVPIQVI